MSLRDLATAKVKRDGRRPELFKWLDTLTPELRAEVIDLLDSDINSAAVWRTLRDHCNYTGCQSTVEKWRSRSYVHTP